MNALTTYVDAWSESARRVIDLLSGLPDSAWSKPTDCPDWTVRDVVAHLSAIESELAGIELGAPAAMVLDGAHVASADYTAAGVAARAALGPAQLVAELSQSYEARLAELVDLPDDPKAAPPRTPGGVAWDIETLLRNRAVDMWVHEQDVRRAVASPGGFDGLAAQVVSMTFAAGMPYVLGKKVGPPAGTTVVWDVRGSVPFELPVGIGSDGRAKRLDATPDPTTVTLRMDTEAFAMLCAGRARTRVPLEIEGDQTLGENVATAMAITG